MAPRSPALLSVVSLCTGTFSQPGRHCISDFTDGLSPCLLVTSILGSGSFIGQFFIFVEPLPTFTAAFLILTAGHRPTALAE